MSRLDNLATWAGTGGNLKHSPLLARIAAHDDHGGGEDARPGERIPVVLEFRSQAPRELFEVVTCSRAISHEAGALAYMSDSPHDVRPWLLLAMFGQDERAIVACHAYGVRYLKAWCWQRRVSESARVIDCAAADGLASLYAAKKLTERKGHRHRRLVPPTDARAKALGIRADRYRDMRNRMQLMFKLRFMEACSRFCYFAEADE